LVIKALNQDWIRIRIGIQPKMLDPDPDEMNADPQPWFNMLRVENPPTVLAENPPLPTHNKSGVILLYQPVYF
jgi:hypothetical protein